MSRSEKEIAHGQVLLENDPEMIWGWETPAGRIRAKRRGRMIIEGGGVIPGTKVLEIGCGTGLFTEIFAATGAIITAIDISDELLNLAYLRNLPADRVIFLREQFEVFDFDSHFESVIGSSILHHLDIVESLSRIFDLLKPGGKICFTEPNMLNPQIFLQKNIPWLKSKMGDSPDETAFVRWRLDSLLRRTGFINVQIMPFDWLHPATPINMIRHVQSVGALLEKTPVLKEFAGSLFIKAERPQE